MYAACGTTSAESQAATDAHVPSHDGLKRRIWRWERAALRNQKEPVLLCPRGPRKVKGRCIAGAVMSVVRKLEPGHCPPAAPPPPPPRGKAGNEQKPPAVFRIAASRARLRHARPAQVGDLNADNAGRRLDRDRDHLAGSTRSAVPQI